MSSELPPGHPDQPEEQLDPLPSSIPDGDEDKPPRELVIQVSDSQRAIGWSLTYSPAQRMVMIWSFRPSSLDVLRSDSGFIKTNQTVYRICPFVRSDSP